MSVPISYTLSQRPERVHALERRDWREENPGAESDSRPSSLNSKKDLIVAGAQEGKDLVWAEPRAHGQWHGVRKLPDVRRLDEVCLAGLPGSYLRPREHQKQGARCET